VTPFRRVCLLGFGEVGQTLATDLARRGGVELAAWDILFPNASSAPARAAGGLVRAGRSAADAIGGSDLVISAVTAAECVAAATSAAPALTAGAAYLDLNSVSPATRKEACTAIEVRGGRYVEAAVMSPIGPKRIATAMLLGGPHAEDLFPPLRDLGLVGATVYSTTLGQASAAKMCRSVVVKGMEALLGEALLAARHHRVDAAVIDSLRDLFPGVDWRKLGRYMISRSLQHGRRRAEEMREVVRTVDAAGIGDWMSVAAVARQDWAAGHADALVHEELEPMLDAILARLASEAGAHDR